MSFKYSQLLHRLRNIRQRVKAPQVAVTGGYHYGNLGDMALGESVAEHLKNRSVPCGLQTIYNLDKWPKATRAVVGGGAVGYGDSMTQIIRRYQGSYHHVALLGVDFNEASYSEECLKLFRECAWISCRSQPQAESLGKMCGRTPEAHPDLVFSLHRDFCQNIRQDRQQPKAKRLLVNVIPLYGTLNQGRVVPDEGYRNERPFLYDHFDEMQRSYRQAVRTTVQRALDEGYQIESVPFTYEDEEMGRLILDGLPVKHWHYHPYPRKMLALMASADWVLATRFHATIFGFKLGARITPIAYASKNEALLQSLGADRSSYLTTDDLARGNHIAPEPQKIPEDVVTAFETQTSRAISACLDSVLR